MRFQAPRGTHDILPGEVHRWQVAERTFADLARLYGYCEIRTPLFEEFDLFVRSSGETSEVVSKQMYDFQDKGNRHLALKPEGTAPAIRAYLQHSLGAQGGTTRLWYATPFFRYERPQKGRYRQAHQLGLELLGSASPEADAEVINLTVEFYAAMGLESLVVSINCIGRVATRRAYGQAILAHLAGFLEGLDEEAQDRACKNPLRILDWKDPAAQQALTDLPPIGEYLEDESRESFDHLQTILERTGAPYKVDPSIVRGLDYYTDTVFEVHAPELGAQTALCGGGRYDDLVKEMGGPPTPAVGVGIGLERLLMVQEAFDLVAPKPPTVEAFVIPLQEEFSEIADNVLRELRFAGVSATVDFAPGSLKSQLKQADRLGARFAVILGEDEVDRGEVSLREMGTGEQRRIARGLLVQEMRR